MWEIFSFGSDPIYYDPKNPSIVVADADLLNILKRPFGVRLNCPEICGNSINIYNLMLKCWSESPKERPSVDQIKKELIEESEYQT